MKLEKQDCFELQCITSTEDCNIWKATARITLNLLKPRSRSSLTIWGEI
jgi:hypothetical protein